MKHLLLVNPSAHGGRRKRNCFAALDNAGIEYETVLLKTISEAEEAAGNAGKNTVVIACGGDGTINAAVNGILKGNGAALGVLYAGTSPDFCKFHRIPTNPAQAAAVIRTGGTKPVDVMQIRHSEAKRTDYFCCSCNLGFGAAVAEDANRLRPYLGDRCGTLLSLLNRILRSKAERFLLDGEPLGECAHLLITKMPWIASGLRLNLPLSPGDGRYAVWYARKLNLSEWLRLLPALYSGHAPDSPEIICELRSSPLRIESAGPGRLEFDGDPRGTLPAEISVCKQKLNLICGG